MAEVHALQFTCPLKSMTGRRRGLRYRLSAPFDVALTLFRDVTIERNDGREIVAISDEPAGTGEDMLLDVVGGGTQETLRVRVVESKPALIGGDFRYRLRLAIER